MKVDDRTPLGITLWETTQLVTREFDRILAEFEGNRPIWFVFLALDAGRHTTQRGLAAEIGIKEATLTHHLTALERRGLVRRTRDDADRRVQRIEFTEEGRSAFETMRRAAIDFDKRIREALGQSEVDALSGSLRRLAEAVMSLERATDRPRTDSMDS